jgi:hypothetical protein
MGKCLLGGFWPVGPDAPVLLEFGEGAWKGTIGTAQHDRRSAEAGYRARWVKYGHRLQYDNGFPVDMEAATYSHKAAADREHVPIKIVTKMIRKI